MYKRISLISLILVAFFCITSVANATIYSSEYITDCVAQAARSSGNTITVTFNISGTGTMDVIGAKTIVIQEKALGSSSWTAVATMSSNDNSNMLAYNTRRHASNVYYYGAKSGYQYRAKVYFYAEKGGYDTREFITAAV